MVQKTFVVEEKPNFKTGLKTKLYQIWPMKPNANNWCAYDTLDQLTSPSFPPSLIRKLDYVA